MDHDESEDHSHCRTCHRANCGTKPPVVSHCPVIPCKLRCGARFHACKLDEHKDFCQLEKVECINSVSGCPLIIQRNKLGAHLERCPASVVYCTMEWNRWPVYSHERQSRVPFVGDNLHAQYGQLDVALALRDQRMLNQAMKAPRSTRRALRNNLTQRFPAVPIRLNSSTPESITSGSSSRTDSNEDIDARRNIEYPPGLERSICNALFKATRNAVENLTTPKKHNPESLVGTSAGLTMKNEAEGTEETGREFDTGIDNSINYCRAAEPSDTRLNGGDSQKEEETESNDNLVTGKMSPEVSSDVGEVVDNINEIQGTDHTPVSVAESGHIPEPPCLPPLNPLRETLALDLNLESITRYQAKPKSMYTFLCAQEFRRDEYASHFKNVHDVIHSGLNGWLEQRCPLSHYGCTYSMRRLYAGEKGAEIVHNDILNSFGVKPHLPPHQCDKPTLDALDIVLDTSKSTFPPKYLTSTEDFCKMECNGNFDDSSNMILNDKNKMKPAFDSPPKDFSSLPFEVVRQIALYLDSYSLCNLALTNRLLREVACSLLEEKGIVIQQWERRLINGRPSWDISHKRWIYSTAFSDIKKWGYEDYLPLGDHLKVCPFYHRGQADAPHHLPSIKCGHHHSDNFCEIMQRMYPDFTLNRDGEEPVCTAGAGLCC